MPNNKPTQNDEELKQKIEEITQTMLLALSEWQADSVVNYTSIKEEGRQELLKLIKVYSLQERIDELQQYLAYYGDDYDHYAEARIADLKKELEALK
jgi:hypothetical protein